MEKLLNLQEILIFQVRGELLEVQGSDLKHTLPNQPAEKNHNFIMKLYQSHRRISLEETFTSHASTHQELTFFLKPLMKL